MSEGPLRVVRGRRSLELLRTSEQELQGKSRIAKKKDRDGR